MKRLSIVAALALAAIACGAPQQIPQVEKATAKTLAEGTARTYTKQVMDFADDSRGVLTMESQGVIDFEGLRQHATMTASGEGGQAETIAQQIGEMEMISEGFIIYMRAPALTSFIPGAKEWLKMDLQAVGEEMGLDFGSLINDPAQQLNYLTGVEDVEEVGTDEIRGTETTHYRGTATFDALKEELSSDADETIDRLQELLDIDEFGVDVWIDADGLVRRMQFEYETIPFGGISTEGTWTFLLEYYDFGTPVDDIKPPPEHKVTDFNELQEQMGTGP